MNTYKIFAPEDLVFEIDGEVWRMPGDIDTDTVVKLQGLGDRLYKGDSSAMPVLKEEIKGIFALKHTEEELKNLRLGFSALMQITNATMQYLLESIPKNVNAPANK